MKIKGYQTNGKPIVDLIDYYRDDYDMLLEILSCRWSEVLIVGLRRFGKSSLLKRIEGFVNGRDDYREFLDKGLKDWNRDVDGNTPRQEFFNELNQLDAKALYISFLSDFDTIEEEVVEFFESMCGQQDALPFRLKKIEHTLPPKLFILMDEFLKLADLTLESEKKREFFLKLHRSTQELSREVVFVIAEPPSIRAQFQEAAKKDSSISEITEALLSNHTFTLNGLSPQEKLNLFRLTKSKNYGKDTDEIKVNDILSRLSGIPLEIQIAGEAFFSHPEWDCDEVIRDVIGSFRDNINRIISTMSLRQRVFIRLVMEFESNLGGLPWERIKGNGQRLFEHLRNFGILKKDDENLVRFSSEPIQSILLDELEDWNVIVEDELYNRERRSIIYSDEEIKKSTSHNAPSPWNGKIRIHHFSDLALSNLIKGINYNEETAKIDLLTLNQQKNPFYAYFKLLKNHPKHRPHIIVFTGDIALNNHHACYTALKKFIAYTTEFMNPLPGQSEVIDKKQVILVPGEVDISNPMENECESEVEAFDPCNFSDFFKTFSPYAIPAENSSQNSLEDLIKIQLPPTHGVPGYSLEFLPFNSATMVWGDKTDIRRLTILKKLTNDLLQQDETLTRQQIDELLGNDIGFLNVANLGKSAGELENIDDTLRIAVVHHNLNPHIVRTEDYTVDTLNAHEAKTTLLKNHFSIVLHGHQRSPLFIKETLYLSDLNSPNDRKGLKTLFMNGAGNFTETKFPVDHKPFGPSFNSYDLHRINSSEEGLWKLREGGFILKSTVFKYEDDLNKFTADHLKITEDIANDED